MDTHELEQILLEEIGYAEKPELVSSEAIPWMNNRPIQKIDWAVLLNNAPLAYFSRFSDLDLEAIKDLHKKVWSQSRAPLLFIILPNEIRVYNGYEPPPYYGEDFDTEARLLHCLEELTNTLKARKRIREELVEPYRYERVYLETGVFWNTKENQKINHRKRADRQLVESMGDLRKILTNEGLSNHVAYTLLGRSVFIRYLEDRGVLTSDWIEQLTDGQAHDYLDALPNRQVTYLLFERLSAHFNGDLFPIEAAEEAVTEKHLNTLLRFLSGEKLETGQLGLWPFNFEYIPIELISHIYDTFIGDQRKTGAYYTPLLLADFMLEETLGEDVTHPGMTVLDPACGSGIFLVGSYRRLIQARRKENGELTPDDLSQILKENIFGVDINSEAVRIAAFSLYLEILNHLDNDQIRDEVFRFPLLIGENLIKNDFFAEAISNSYFGEQKFDRIVGNMPWGQSTLTPAGQKWLKENDLTVGGKQAAPAFMLRAPQFCKIDGEIALLTSTKSSILVTSATHQRFRDDFFTTYNVQAVVNFSAMRKELFGDAISPAVAIFYSPNPPNFNKKLVYGVPKPSPLSRHLKAIVLDTTEIKFLDRQELLDKPYLWKVALWGTPRDAALIERLKSNPTLSEQANELGWTIGEGIQIGGGDKNPAPWLEDANLVPTNQLRPYFVDMSVCERITEKVFHRPRIPELVEAPLTLIRQSECSATFSDQDIAYRDKISGITGHAGQEWLLYWLVAYINSPLAKYYHFLTSTSWGVERGNIIQQEYERMPFLIPNENDTRLNKVLQYLEWIKNMLEEDSIFFDAKQEAKLVEYKKAINELVFDLYELHPIERQLVKDTLEFGLGYFNWARRKNRKPQGTKPVKHPTEEMLKSYADTFAKTASSLLRVKNQALSALIYRNGAPLTVVSFYIVDADERQAVQTITQPDAMRSKLRELDNLILEQQTPSMYIRRHVRIYDGDQISLVRPSEQRFWTQSQARVDADAFLAELSS